MQRSVAHTTDDDTVTAHSSCPSPSSLSRGDTAAATESETFGRRVLFRRAIADRNTDVTLAESGTAASPNCTGAHGAAHTPGLKGLRRLGMHVTGALTTYPLSTSRRRPSGVERRFPSPVRTEQLLLVR